MFSNQLHLKKTHFLLVKIKIKEFKMLIINQDNLKLTSDSFLTQRVARKS